jgi:site-specific DNA recombinase
MTKQGLRSQDAKQTQTVRVGIYLRNSSDRAGDELAVQRQLSSCRALMRAKGLPREVDVYEDNDTSASGRVERPHYQRMLRDVESGRIDCVVVWSFDRLTRSMSELEGIIALHEKHGMNLITVDGDLNLSTEVGRLVVRILAAVARAELEMRRKRQLNERVQKAEQGAVHGGGPRPFGYEEDRVRVRESEAKYVRDAAARVLAGESLRSIVADFAKKGVTMPDHKRDGKIVKGASMTQQRLRLILISARISGRRQHWQGKLDEKRPVLAPIVGDAVWDEIISADDSDRLRELLTQKTRQTNSGGARVHLLAGFLYCSECKRRMVSSSSGNAARFTCDTAPGETCRKTVRTKHIDEMIVEGLLGMIDTPKYRKFVQKKHGIDQKLVQSLAADERELIELSAQKARGEIEFDEWRTMRDIVKQRRDDTKQIIDDAMRDDAMRALLGRDDSIDVAWSKLTLSQQRGVVDGAIERIVISPPTKRGNFFDPKRVDVLWRG